MDLTYLIAQAFGMNVIACSSRGGKGLFRYNLHPLAPV